MAKYLATWEINQSLVPDNPKDMAALAVKMSEMVKQELKEGQISDWGCSIDGSTGYSLLEGNSIDTYKRIQMYAPYVKFKVEEVLSIDNVLKTYKAMMK